METRGIGCFELSVATLILLALLIVLVGSAGGSRTTATTSTDTRSGVLSGNQVEVLSRNQLNVMSNVKNCYGDDSCETTVISTTTNAPIIIDGDHSGVGVTRLCVDSNGNGYQTNQPCGLGYTAVQP